MPPARARRCPVPPVAAASLARERKGGCVQWSLTPGVLQVNIARIYNFDVLRRKKMKEHSARVKAQVK